MNTNKPLTEALQYIGAFFFVVGAFTWALALILQFPALIVLQLFGANIPDDHDVFFRWVWAITFVLAGAGLLVMQLVKESASD